MLQQTTVATVKAYFERFIQRWPTVAALAAAPIEEVLEAWAGLGYYARARNLHACARVVVERHGGDFPADEAMLRALPGIGAYTAAAIAAIAFGRRAVALDGNIERVIARLHAVEEKLPEAKPALRRLAEMLVPEDRPGDYTQAAMDLGATICTPRAPRCVLCPWREPCVARAKGIAEALPARHAKGERPTRFGIAFVAVREDGAILLRRRPARGLLGGMLEVPGSEWIAEPPALAPPAELGSDWRELPGRVQHTFTHFHLELRVFLGRAVDGDPDALWAPLDRLGDLALPTLMRKVIAHALRHGGGTAPVRSVISL
jgi:A/G-specific adenine glycosylase